MTKPKNATTPTLIEQKDPEETIGIIQGTIPGSKNEWYVAMALDKLKIEYQYQVGIDGGKNVRGGQVIDFVAYLPQPTPIFVQGEYWHNQKTETEDLLKFAAAENVYKRSPILLMGDETDTKDKAFQVVRDRVK